MITKIEQLTNDDLIILANTAINVVAANKSHTRCGQYTLYFWDYSVPGILLSDGNYYKFTAIKLTKDHEISESVSNNIGAVLTLDNTGYSVLYLHNTLTECVYPYPKAIDPNKPLINLHNAVQQTNLKIKMKEGI